jgi:nitrite reductase/ring-hydroxylating ferredoxin subunit
MDQELIEHFRRRLAFTDTRPGLPEGYPEFPVIRPDRYIDQRFYDLEQTHVFRTSWLMAGHADQLPEPGCYKTWDRAGEPVILFHGQDGVIRAFYNICRHRGAVLTTKPYGKSRTLGCAYHGWIFDNKGDLVSIRDQRDFPNFDKACYSLRSIRCEMLGKMIFVNFDDNAEDLVSSLGQLAKDFIDDFAFDLTCVVEHDAWVAPCNWKLLVEGGIENYHVRTIHRKTLPNYRENQGMHTLYPGGHSRDTILQDGLKDEEGLVLDGFVRRHDAEVMLDDKEDDRPMNPRINDLSNEVGFIYSGHPNMQFGPFYSRGFVVSCYWPTGLETALHEFYVFGYGDKESAKSVFWPRDVAQAKAVLQEDLDFIEMVQKGIKSRGNMGVKLGYLEARLQHLNETLDNQIGVENVPPECRIEQVIGKEWVFPNDIALYEAEMDRVNTKEAAE